MKGKKIAIFVCMLVIASVFPIVTTSVASDGSTIYVDDDAPNDPGPGDPDVSDPLEDGSEDHPFDEIQEGVDVASDGDAVYVYSGIYYENVVVDKSIDLIGENKDTTIIDDGGNEDIIYVSADWVNISGFTIRNGYSGIQLDHASNITIYENAIANNRVFGINLQSSSNNNTIFGNSIANNNEYGIYLNGNYNIISGNSIANNYNLGIRSRMAHNNKIIDNYFISNGINIDGRNIHHYNTHIIENNYVNGKPIYYYKNDNGVTVPSDAAQVILANCSHFSLKNLNIVNVDCGIQLGFSLYTNITENNIIDNNKDGISLQYSSGNNLTTNTIKSNNNFGINLKSSSNNNLSKNTIINNGVDLYLWGGGIYLWDSSRYNNISGNTITNNGYGINLESSFNNNIRNNIITDNTWSGIDLLHSSNNIISDNSASRNGNRGIYLEEDSNTNIISDNGIYSNDMDGIELVNNLFNMIYYNQISSNKRNGIRICDSSETNISNNNIDLNMLCGIKMEVDSSGNLIIGNTLWMNIESAIKLYWFSSGNNISKNYIYGSITGVYLLSDSIDNTIYRNNINGSVTGIKLELSNGNRVTYNNILKLTDIGNHAFFVKCKNFWWHNFWSGMAGRLFCPIPGRVGPFLGIIPWLQFDFNPATGPNEIDCLNQEW